MAGFTEYVFSMMSTLKRVIVFIVLLSCMEVLLTECAPIPTRPCGVDQFLDISGMCEFCTVVCDDAVIQGTLGKCRQNCPGFLTTHAPATSTLTQTTTPVSTPDQPLTNRILVVVGVVAFVICSIIIAAAVFRHRLLNWISQRCKRIQKLKFPIQEVDDDDDDGYDDDGDDGDDGDGETLSDDESRPDVSESLINPNGNSNRTGGPPISVNSQVCSS